MLLTLSILATVTLVFAVWCLQEWKHSLCRNAKLLASWEITIERQDIYFNTLMWLNNNLPKVAAADNVAMQMELDEAHYQIALALQEGMKSGEPGTATVIPRKHCRPAQNGIDS